MTCSVIIAFSRVKPDVCWSNGILKCAKFLPLLMMLALAGCGGGSSSSNQPTTSLIKTRALVSNSFVGGVGGALEIIDYSKDQLTTFSMGCCNSWTRMQVSADRSRTYAIIAPPSVPTLVAFDNSKEAQAASMNTSGPISSFVGDPANKFMYAAVRNTISTTFVPGEIEFIDTTNTSATVQRIPVPFVTGLTINHAGTTLLALSDQNDNVVIADPVALTTKTITGFARPIAAFFSSDDTKAYIVNCGAQCGASGQPASVTVLDMTNPAPPTTSVPVQAATTALLDGTTLYVAGPGTTAGSLTVLNVNGATVTPSGPAAAIGDGTPQIMRVVGTKLFVGARTCVSGCLSIVDLSSKAATIDPPKGDVTGITAVPGRNEVYVAEGGEVRVYDTTTNKESTSVFIDVVGKAEDVAILDQ